jgi:hypothetical protein
MASITITSPTSGSTVSQQFTASGTWTLDTAGVPLITCSILGTMGTVTINPPFGTSGTWEAVFDLTTTGSGQTLQAAITGTTASDEVTNITVQ